MTTSEIAKHLITEQYKLVGLSYDDACKLTREEFLQYEITEQQQNEWLDYAVKFLRKKKRWPVLLCRKEVMMLDFNYGLKLKL